MKRIVLGTRLTEFPEQPQVAINPGTWVIREVSGGAAIVRVTRSDVELQEVETPTEETVVPPMELIDG